MSSLHDAARYRTQSNLYTVGFYQRAVPKSRLRRIELKATIPFSRDGTLGHAITRFVCLCIHQD